MVVWNMIALFGSKQSIHYVFITKNPSLEFIILSILNAIDLLIPDIHWTTCHSNRVDITCSLSKALVKGTRQTEG